MPRLFIKRHYLFCLLAFASGWSGQALAASPTEITTRYSPLNPQNNQAVTITVRANDPAGVSRIRLYIYEYQWASNGTDVEKRASGRWGKVKDWSITGTQPSVNRQENIAGFPANSFVIYGVLVDNKTGQSKLEQWGFAAGDWPLGNEPIPIWIAPPTTGTPGSLLAGTTVTKTNRINTVFIAQQNDGYARPRDLLSDLDGIIFDGFLANDAIKMGKQFWAFYYSPEFGSISPYRDDGSATMTQTAAQYAATNVAANVGTIVHRTEFRDWSEGHFFGTEPGVNNFGTTLHEIGHSVFDLADEYPASNWTSDSPFHNNYNSQSACMVYNFNNNWLSTDAQAINNAFWRPEPAGLNCTMRIGNTIAGAAPHYARSCLKRVQWFYERLQ